MHQQVAFADLYHGARLAVKRWSAALGWTAYAATSPFVAPSQFASPSGPSGAFKRPYRFS